MTMPSTDQQKHMTVLTLVRSENMLDTITSEQYRTTAVATIDALLEALKSTPAGVVILDDTSICEQVRSATALPILMLVESDTIEAAIAAGADDCMRLPLHPDILHIRIEALHRLNSSYAYDTLPVMVHSIGQDLRVRYVNPYWLETLGYTYEEVIGQPITSFMDESSRLVFHLIIDDLWTTERLDDIRHRLVRKDGRGIDVLLTSETITERTGDIVGLTIARDISDLTQVEESLLTSEQQTQSILNAMTDAVMVMDANGYYLRVLTHRMSSLGIDPQTYENKHVYDLGSRASADRIMAAIDEAITTDKPSILEYSVPVKDGEKRWFHATYSPIRAAQQVVVVIREITEQKLAEETLRDSERRYRNLFESANDGILIIDMQTAQIVDGNDQIARMLGYTLSDLRGKHINNIEQPLDNLDTDSNKLDQSNHLIHESRYNRSDGSLIPVETSNRIIRYENRPALLVFVRDITKRKQAYDAELRQRRWAEALRDTAAAFNSVLSFDEVLDTLLDNVSKVVPNDTANIMLIDTDNPEICRIVRVRGYEQRGHAEDTILGLELDWQKAQNLRMAAETGEPYIIHNTNAPDIDWLHQDTEVWVNSVVTAPVILEDQVIGFINLDSQHIANFTDDEAQRLQAFANQAAIAFQKAQLFEQIEAKVTERTEALQLVNDRLREEIQQRQEVEEQLANEQQLLSTLIETIPDAIYIKDRESRFILANVATREMVTGSKEAELAGKTDFDYIPKERAQPYYKEEQAVMETGKPIINRENTYVRNDGTIFYDLVTKLPLHDTNGNIIGIIGVNHDITELQQTQAQLNQVLTSARCLLWYSVVTETDDNQIEWELTVANEQAAQNFLPLDTTNSSYSEAWQQAILTEDRDKRDYVLHTHLRFGKLDYTQEFRCNLVDGDTRWLLEDVHLIPLGNKRWSLVGVVTDITERKAAEYRTQEILEQLELRVQERTENLRQTNAELIEEISERRRVQEQERQQRLLAEALHQSVSVLNSTLDRDAVFDNLLDGLQSIVPHDASSIMLLQDDYNTIIVRARNHDESVQGRVYDIREMQNVWLAYQTGEPIIINDVPNFEGWKDDDIASWINSNVCTPIPLGDSIIGFLNLDSIYRNNFSDEDAQHLKTFAIQAGNAIRNARMLEEIRDYADSLEQRVEERTIELERERAQLHAILNSMHDGLVYQTDNQDILYINNAMTSITGYTLEEWQSGAAQAGMNTDPQDVRDEQWRKVEKMLDYQGYWQGETTIDRKDGTTIDVALTRTEVRDNNRRIGIVTVLRDISQAKILEAQKARFIASASHELRTPITNMKTRLFLMRRRPEKMEKHLEVIESVVNLMQRIVETMFDISRFERGVIELQSEEFPIQELVRNVYSYHEIDVERRDINFINTMPATPIMVYADPYRLTQVLTNLVKNSLNYTPNGGTVETIIEVEDDTVILRVADTGEGIPEENKPHLFKPFFRGREDNLGTGLGLSISQEIVARHGGTIEVESEVGVGSTFTVRFPISQPRGEITPEVS